MWPSLYTTEILDLDTLTWTYGPNMPAPIRIGRTVPYKNSFIVVGGDGRWPNGAGLCNFPIYEWNINSNSWTHTGITLPTCKYSIYAFLVPDFAVNCP